MIPRERTPARRLAAGLMPIASVRTPRAVLRTMTVTTMIAASAMRNSTGKPRRYPFDSDLYGPLLIVVMNPPVIRRAMPRPANKSTRVAMIGCIPTTVTRNPFHTPNARVIPTPARIATVMVPMFSGVVRLGDDRQRHGP